MKGTERQIAWADTIIANWDHQIDDVLATAKARVENKSMPELWLNIVTASHEVYKARLNSINDASKVIAMKNANLGAKMFGDCGKQYDSQQ